MEVCLSSSFKSCVFICSFDVMVVESVTSFLPCYNNVSCKIAQCVFIFSEASTALALAGLHMKFLLSKVLLLAPYSCAGMLPWSLRAQALCLLCYFNVS